MNKAWASIVVYYLCGVMAAAQLGKFAALAPLISQDLALGLAAMAALTSLLEVSGAVFGGVAGRLLPRLGLRRGLMLALACLGTGAVAAALARHAPLLAAARLVESVGYLITVVAAPVLIARTAPRAQQAAAMTLWSTFVPVGMALGAWAYAHAAELGSWRWAQALSVAAALVLMAGLWRAATPGAEQTTQTEPADPARPSSPQPPSSADAPRVHGVDPALWLLTLAFGLYAVTEVGLLALLPSLLVQSGAQLAGAGSWTAAAALANVPASALAAWLMRRQGTIAWALVLPLLVSGLLFPWAYQVDQMDTGLLPQAVVAVLINLISGVFASLVFALLPRFAADERQLSLASGRLTQCGASGALLGPPLMGALVQHWGWAAAGWASVGLALASAGLAWRVVRGGRMAGRSVAAGQDMGSAVS
ncbi:MAG: hypothetical protein DI603_10930 [Roseateles depolymerans]|uniref:Major facilitator superfamily (MFS) profile domain-containing protein n=1 Tax=Roseateles depolymerans TaxID=76731 RepID=A0A2W5DS11_9BURK|nr:MAG: hypothetical protein DI603_10930 [Roseateles depolymerans]